MVERLHAGSGMLTLILIMWLIGDIYLCMKEIMSDKAWMRALTRCGGPPEGSQRFNLHISPGSWEDSEVELRCTACLPSLSFPI